MLYNICISSLLKIILFADEMFFVGTQSLILYVLHAKIKNRKILFKGTIRCLICLTRKARVKLEVN